MGKVKEFSSIPNLYTILHDEGFLDIKLTYLGGLWVLIELDKLETKEALKNHTGIKSWFQVIKDACNDFVSEERIVWMDIEGVPIHAWSRESFIRIGKKWGDTLNLEDNADSSFGRKRFCLKMKHPTSILETFKIIIKGKVFMVRAKKLFTWNPVFSMHKERDCLSVDESVQAANNFDPFPNDNVVESEDEYVSNNEGVPETVFGSYLSSLKQDNRDTEESQSKDPFELYDLLNKKPDDKCIPSPSLSHPPGFTPEVSEKHDDIATNHNATNYVSANVNAKVMNTSQEVPVESLSESVGKHIINNGGSVLGVMEDIIRVGQTMGYTMEGCAKDLEAIIGQQGDMNETKLSNVSHMDVKLMWGNSNYDYVCSDSLGNSGGILCIWEASEASIFKKDNVTISDNFIAIYGTWLPSKSNILFVAVYAPQPTSCKRILWDYLSTLVGRWNGETIIMGDFNKVRSINERRGSCFNPYSARLFDHFILNSGLVDVNLEGYAFTWSHPSASKMSKLDRFLIPCGIFTIFPSLTAIDRHLSDHRPIVLQEVHLDFGPTVFRFYHFWFDYVGFDDLIKSSWLSFSHSDGNGMIRFKKKLQDLKVIIRHWIKGKRSQQLGSKNKIVTELGEIDRDMDRGVVNDDNVLRRFNLKRDLLQVSEVEAKDRIQKSKIKWAVEG
nr:RNA-directed DNA polymerase, eukaryota [Tanacetum cinerariifolium]